MHIKIFEAETMSQALLLVKREFGPDAVILSARSVRGGLLKNRRVEVTAATDAPSAFSKGTQTAGAAASPSRPRTIDFPAPRPWQAAQAYRLKKSSAAPSNPRPDHGAALQEPAPAPVFREKAALRRHLRRQGVGRDLTHELICELAEGGPVDAGRDLPRALADAMAESSLGCERIRIRQGLATVAAMVGPPGVGKTTAVVKLAALARKRLGAERVGIIAVDNARLGAVEQLLDFAAVVGVDARVVRKPAELSRALAHWRKMALVLVDTAGVNSADRHGMLELKNFFQRCRRQIEIHLLLAASTKEEDQLGMAEGFGALNFERLLFTRVDETARHGNLLNLMNCTQVPVSYLSQGQRIPEDLKIATLEKLAALVLRNWSAAGKEAPAEPREGQWMTG